MHTQNKSKLQTTILRIFRFYVIGLNICNNDVSIFHPIIISYIFLCKDVHGYVKEPCSWDFENSSTD